MTCAVPVIQTLTICFIKGEAMKMRLKHAAHLSVTALFSFKLNMTSSVFKLKNHQDMSGNGYILYFKKMNRVLIYSSATVIIVILAKQAFIGLVLLFKFMHGYQQTHITVSIV